MRDEILLDFDVVVLHDTSWFIAVSSAWCRLSHVEYLIAILHCSSSRLPFTYKFTLATRRDIHLSTLFNERLIMSKGIFYLFK